MFLNFIVIFMQLLKNEGHMYVMSWMDVYNKLLGKKQRMTCIFLTFNTLTFSHCVYNFLQLKKSQKKIRV